MNHADKIELDIIKRTGYQTDRERVLLEALEEAEALEDTVINLENRIKEMEEEKA